MILLPEIALSARFRNDAQRARTRFLRRVFDMRWRDLRPLLLPGHSAVVGAMIHIRYAPRAIAVRFVPATASAWDADVTAIGTTRDPAIEIQRLRSALYLRHAGTLLSRRVGGRPYLTESDEQLARTCRDGIHPVVLQSGCGRDGDETLIRYELFARLA